MGSRRRTSPITIAAATSSASRCRRRIDGFIADAEATPSPALRPIPGFRLAGGDEQAGEFIITWVAYQDNDVITSPDLPDSYGIYYRVFDADGTAADRGGLPGQPGCHHRRGAYSLAQSDAYAGDQLNPSVAMDADGDYVITWDGNGANR